MAINPELVPIANKLKGVQIKGSGGLVAFCPAHKDEKQRSLSIDMKDGTIVLHCFTGCQPNQIVEALGLRWAELFGDTKELYPSHTQASPPKTIVYKILGKDGSLLAEHERRETANGKTFVWKRDGVYSLGDLKASELPLYRSWELPDLSTPEALSAYLVICEGEKATSALWDKGIMAVGTYGADIIPPPRILETLKEWDIFLWPDNDEPGRKHMNRIARILVALGNDPLIIQWADAPPHGDAADYPGDPGELMGNAVLYEDSDPYQPAVKEEPLRGHGGYF